VKVQEKLAYGREVALTKFNETSYLHIYDNWKCWDSKTRTYNKSMGKCLSLSWQHALALRQALHTLEQYANQIEIEGVSQYNIFINLIIVFLLSMKTS